MTFYTGLRDDTAGPLIDQFGQSGTYRVHASESYDNATGKTTKGAPTDTAVKLLELKGDGPRQAQEWSEDVASMMRTVVLLSAKEFAAEGVTPEVDEALIYAGKENRILGIKAVAPGGVAVIYKMAVQYA